MVIVMLMSLFKVVLDTNGDCDADVIIKVVLDTDGDCDADVISQGGP